MFPSSGGENRSDLASLFGFFADTRKEPLMQDFCNGRLAVSGIVNYLQPDEADRTAADAPSRSSDRAPRTSKRQRKN